MIKNTLFLLMFLAISPQAFSAAISGNASWYSTEACQFNKDPKCPMANGESLYNAQKKEKRFAAMWGIPLGSRVKVCNPSTGKCVVVQVLDRGPNKRLSDRVIDLSKNSFSEISETRLGVIPVTVERI